MITFCLFSALVQIVFELYSTILSLFPKKIHKTFLFKDIDGFIVNCISQTSLCSIWKYKKSFKIIKKQINITFFLIKQINKSKK
jgi:hypothetical protein